MALVTGNDVAYGSGGYYDARISYSVANISNTVARITYHEYAYHNTSLYDSSNNAGDSGGIASGTFGARSYSSSVAGTMSYRSGTKDVTRVYGGSSVSQTFWVEGLADGSGGGARSTVTATIPIDARPITAPSSPGTPSVSDITTSGATFAWPDPADWGGDDTSNFDVQYANNEAMTNPTTVTVVGNTKAVTGLGNNTPMWVRVAGRNSAGLGAWSPVVPFTTLVAIPSTAGQPTASSVSNSSAVCTWGDPSSWGGQDTSQFYARRAGNSGMSGAVSELVTGNTKTWTGLTGNTSYWVDDAATNSAGTGPYSATRSFLTKPSLATGLAASGISPTSATVTCVAPVGGASSYRLQVATDAGFTNVVHDSTDTNRSRTVTGLTPATTYHYRWLTANTTGNVGWTTAATFDTLAGAYIWTGAAWVNATPYVWTGGAWVAASVYVWRSGAWRQ